MFPPQVNQVIVASARAGWSEIDKQTGSGLTVMNSGIVFRAQASRGDSEGLCCSVALKVKPKWKCFKHLSGPGIC